MKKLFPAIIFFSFVLVCVPSKTYSEEDGWYAWHSLSIHREDTGEFGETDFVIAIPNRPAILLLEVIEIKKDFSYPFRP